MQKKPVPSKLSFTAYSEKILESQYFKENNCEDQGRSVLHQSLMTVHARQSVSKHIFIYYCHTRDFFDVFLSKPRKSHAENSTETTKYLYCKVKCWKTEVNFWLILTLSSSSHHLCLLACGWWVCSQVSQDQRAARVCCPWGCSGHLLHKLDGRQGGRRVWEQKLSWRWHGQLQPNPSSAICPLNQGIHGQLPPSHSTPAYPGSSRCGRPLQLHLAPAFPRTYPVLSSSTCSDKSDTQNRLQKDVFWEVNHSPFKPCSINFD